MVVRAGLYVNHSFVAGSLSETHFSRRLAHSQVPHALSADGRRRRWLIDRQRQEEERCRSCITYSTHQPPQGLGR